MNPVSFRLRHAAIACRRKETQFLKSAAGITPARYDLLRILANTRFNSVLQKDLTERLGVSKQNVQRMTQAMESLRFVRRVRVRRSIVVCLTKLGRLILRHGKKHCQQPFHRFLLKEIRLWFEGWIDTYRRHQDLLFKLERTLACVEGKPFRWSSKLYVFPDPVD